MSSSHLLNHPLIRKVRPFFGVVRRRLRSLPFRTRYQKELLLQDTRLQPQTLALLQQVETRIFHHDGMYTGNGAHYFKVGLSAINCIEEAMEAGQVAPVKHVLDLPCGYGRVLRFLVQRFPEAQFTASDLDRKGVDFCAKTFGAGPLYSEPDLKQLSLDRAFDLIWCGSLITHLDAAGIGGLFDFFQRHLLPGGLLVFSTHGERVIQRMLGREFEYGIAEESIPRIIASYRKTGFGFADYPDATAYGVSLTSPEWIRRQIQELGTLKEVYFRAQRWDEHQDVFGFVQAD